MTLSTIRAARTTAAHAFPGALAAVARAVRRRVSGWRAVQRERAALARLDARMLADIGLDAGCAAREADRPFWDLPPGR